MLPKRRSCIFPAPKHNVKDAHLIPGVCAILTERCQNITEFWRGLVVLRNKCATSAGRLHEGRKSPGARPRSGQSTPFPITTIGIEIGKNTFHLVGLDQDGDIVLQSPVRAIDQKLASAILYKHRGRIESAFNRLKNFQTHRNSLRQADAKLPSLCCLAAAFVWRS